MDVYGNNFTCQYASSGIILPSFDMFNSLGVSMKTFKQFLTEDKRGEALKHLKALFEHEIYKRIPGTSNSYRQDSANTTTNTQWHSHIYAKLNGGGKELYSVNYNGSGHDGSSGVKIPTTHADFFRSKGYNIKSDNILESLSLEKLRKGIHSLIIFEDS